MIYRSVLRHTRLRPIRHDFRYRTYQWLVDLDRPPRIPRALRFLAGFDARDHFDGPSGGTADIKASLLGFLAGHGVDLTGGRVLMLANARIFGHVFNPLTVYWCHPADGGPTVVVAEVHNTYGQRHNYLLFPDERGSAGTDKAFYVSPFFDVSGRYAMSLPEPGERLALSIRLERAGEPVFVAAVHGERRPDSDLLATVVRHPFETLAVSVRIRIQGIRLYLRRLPIVPRPTQEIV